MIFVLYSSCPLVKFDILIIITLWSTLWKFFVMNTFLYSTIAKKCKRPTKTL